MDKLSIYQRLALIRQEAEGITKQATVKSKTGAKMYKYANESDVLAVVKPLLIKYGVSYNHYVTKIKVTNSNVAIYTARFVFYNTDVADYYVADNDEAYTFEDHWIGTINPDDAERKYGGTRTYGIKYTLGKFLHIAMDENDPDRTEQVKAEQHRQAVKSVKLELQSFIRKHPDIKADVKAWFTANSINDPTKILEYAKALVDNDGYEGEPHGQQVQTNL